MLNSVLKKYESDFGSWPKYDPKEGAGVESYEWLLLVLDTVNRWTADPYGAGDRAGQQAGERKNLRGPKPGLCRDTPLGTYGSKRFPTKYVTVHFQYKLTNGDPFFI